MPYLEINFKTKQQKPIVNSLIHICFSNRQVQCGNNTECQATCRANETGVCDHHSRCHCHHSHTYVHMQGIQEKFYKAEQDCFGPRGQGK